MEQPVFPGTNVPLPPPPVFPGHKGGPMPPGGYGPPAGSPTWVGKDHPDHFGKKGVFDKGYPGMKAGFEKGGIEKGLNTSCNSKGWGVPPPGVPPPHYSPTAMMGKPLLPPPGHLPPVHMPHAQPPGTPGYALIPKGSPTSKGGASPTPMGTLPTPTNNPNNPFSAVLGIPSPTAQLSAEKTTEVPTPNPTDDVDKFLYDLLSDPNLDNNVANQASGNPVSSNPGDLTTQNTNKDPQMLHCPSRKKRTEGEGSNVNGHEPGLKKRRAVVRMDISRPGSANPSPLNGPVGILNPPVGSPSLHAAVSSPPGGILNPPQPGARIVNPPPLGGLGSAPPPLPAEGLPASSSQGSSPLDRLLGDIFGQSANSMFVGPVDATPSTTTSPNSEEPIPVFRASSGTTRCDTKLLTRHASTRKLPALSENSTEMGSGVIGRASISRTLSKTGSVTEIDTSTIKGCLKKGDVIKAPAKKEAKKDNASHTTQATSSTTNEEKDDSEDKGTSSTTFDRDTERTDNSDNLNTGENDKSKSEKKNASEERKADHPPSNPFEKTEGAYENTEFGDKPVEAAEGEKNAEGAERSAEENTTEKKDEPEIPDTDEQWFQGAAGWARSDLEKMLEEANTVANGPCNIFDIPIDKANEDTVVDPIELKRSSRSSATGLAGKGDDLTSILSIDINSTCDDLNDRPAETTEDGVVRVSLQNSVDAPPSASKEPTKQTTTTSETRRAACTTTGELKPSTSDTIKTFRSAVYKSSHSETRRVAPLPSHSSSSHSAGSTYPKINFRLRGYGNGPPDSMSGPHHSGSGRYGPLSSPPSKGAKSFMGKEPFSKDGFMRDMMRERDHGRDRYRDYPSDYDKRDPFHSDKGYNNYGDKGYGGEKGARGYGGKSYNEKGYNDYTYDRRSSPNGGGYHSGNMNGNNGNMNGCMSGGNSNYNCGNNGHMNGGNNNYNNENRGNYNEHMNGGNMNGVNGNYNGNMNNGMTPGGNMTPIGLTSMGNNTPSFNNGYANNGFNGNNSSNNGLNNNSTNDLLSSLGLGNMTGGNNSMNNNTNNGNMNYNGMNNGNYNMNNGVNGNGPYNNQSSATSFLDSLLAGSGGSGGNDNVTNNNSFGGSNNNSTFAATGALDPSIQQILNDVWTM